MADPITALKDCIFTDLPAGLSGVKKEIEQLVHKGIERFAAAHAIVTQDEFMLLKRRLQDAERRMDALQVKIDQANTQSK